MTHEIRCIQEVHMGSLSVAPDATPKLLAETQTVGISPLLRELIRAAMDVRQQARLLRALELLATGEKVIDVALALGMKMSRPRQTVIFGSALLVLAVNAATMTAQAAAAPPEAKYQAFKIGSYSAFALQDGALQEPNDGKSFVVGQPTADVAAALQSGGAPGDRFEFSIQPLLVHAGSHVLLFDAGAGSNLGAIAGKLPDAMAAAGEAPANVTDVFISHAHGDHVGGLITSAGALEFPNATIHMSAPEWKWLSGMSAQTAEEVGIPNVTVLVAAIRPKVVPFEPGADLAGGVVKAVAVKGHTPGHSAYRIDKDPNTLLVVGDAMHSYVVSVRKASWKVAFDTDQETGAASRAALVSQCAASKQRLYAEHFPFPGVGEIVKGKDGYTWAPEALH